MLARFYHKLPPGKAAVRSGLGGQRAVFGSGVFVIPVAHRIDFVHTEAEAFHGKVAGVPSDIVVQLILSADDIRRAFSEFGGKDREGTRQVLQAIIDSSTTADVLDARLPEIGFRRI